MELPDIQNHAQKHICVIGAGPGGLAAAHEVLHTSQHKSGLWDLSVFESKSKVGGVWVPAVPIENLPLTPLYDSLTTNIPHPVMQFTSHAFPPSTPVFPPAETVQKYLEDFSLELMPHIHLNTTVDSVDWDPHDLRWNVQFSTGASTKSSQFDLILVANGHYRVPRYPETTGLLDWRNAGKATHSVQYRQPHSLGDTILVVGAGPSASDISKEMLTVSSTVIRSMTTPPAEIEDIAVRIRGRVAEYRANGEVLFEDGSIERGIDHCILATGYQFVFPFLPSPLLHNGLHPRAPPLPSQLYNSTYHLFPLARHVFPLQSDFPPTSLAFIGLPIRVAPFPVMEAQAGAALFAFSNPSALDINTEAVDIMTRYEEIRSRVGCDDPVAIAKAWHVFAFWEEQFDYRDSLHAFADSPIRASSNTKLFYKHKDLLRKTWLELEASGKAEDWVEGVGIHGPQEWDDLLKRMLKHGGIHIENNEAKL